MHARSKCRLIAVAAVWACAGLLLPVPALKAQQSVTVTWEQAVEQTDQRNPELRAAHQDLRAAEYDVRGAHSGFFPQLSGSVGYSDTDRSGSSSSTQEPSRSVALTARQNLFAGFRDQATVKQAGASRVLADANLQIVKARVGADLKSAFAALRFAQDNVRLTEDIIRRREGNLRLVELRFEGGRENKGSYFLSKAALSQARFEHLQARQAVGVAQERLARVLGRDRAEALQVSGDVATSAPPDSVDLRALAQQTPEYRQARARVSTAEAEIRVARAGLLPSLDLTASAANVKEDPLPSERSNTVGVQLSIPLYSGGRDYFAVKSAVASHAASVAGQEDADRQVLTRLRQAYSDFVQAVEKLKVDRDFLEAASVRAEIARNRYNNGLISFEDWDLIENDLITRQKNVLQSERDQVTAESAWEQARGAGPLP